MRRRRLAIATVAAFAISASLPNPGAGHPGHGITPVGIALYQYSPSEISILIGDGANWIWRGPDTNHSVTAVAGQLERFDSDPGRVPGAGDHAVDDNFFHFFQNAGSFTYYCKVHGFKGVVNVSDPFRPILGPLAVRPRSFCLGGDCPKPRFRVAVNERATLRGSIQRRGDEAWRTVRRFSGVRLRRGRNFRSLPADGLPPGAYRLIVTARDPSANRSGPKIARFTILG